MSRWWRAYDDAIHDRKLLKLPDELFRAWFSLLCIASKHDGVLPPAGDIAVMLRMKPAKVAEWLTKLTAATLLDKTETGFVPHNWNGRQYKSDVSTERVKRFRNAKRNVSSAVSETPPDTEQITEPDQNRARETRARDLPSASGMSVVPDDISVGMMITAREAGMTETIAHTEWRVFKARKLSDGKISADWQSEWFVWCERWKAMKRQPVAAEPVDAAKLDYDKQLERFKRGLPWSSKHWGPEPGQGGCLAPAELLAKHGFTTAH